MSQEWIYRLLYVASVLLVLAMGYHGRKCFGNLEKEIDKEGASFSQKHIAFTVFCGFYFLCLSFLLTAAKYL